MASELHGIRHLLFQDPRPVAEVPGLRRDTLVALIGAEHHLGEATKGVNGSILPKAVPTAYAPFRGGGIYPSEYAARGGNPAAFRERMTQVADQLDAAVSGIRRLHPVDGKGLAKSLTGMSEHARGLTRVSDLHLTHQYGLADELSSATRDAKAAYELLNAGPTKVLGHGPVRPMVALAGVGLLAGAMAFGVSRSRN